MKFLGKQISGMFTIPSGIVTTNPKVIERVAHDIPEIGVLTTKSIGLQPREGYREPILAQYSPGCFVNAVGLSNPGADEFARQMKAITIPNERFLLSSIFGKDADEFVAVAKKVAPLSDGLELNLSCPHAKGYGMAIGQDKDLVKKITSAVKKAVKIPVIPKLTPNFPDIGEIAEAAVDGGADGISAINTVGPSGYAVDGQPVLSHGKGGESGREIFPIGLKCVKEIAQKVKLPIIAMGGVSKAYHVKEYLKAGASIVGVGSSLAGMSTEEIKKYFSALNRDVKNGTHTAVLKPVDMTYHKYHVVKNIKLASDLFIIQCDKKISILPGQFIFAWLPGVGEKPFSVLDDNPLTLAIRKAGCFTEKIMLLEKGDTLHIRGPYGVPVQVEKNAQPIMVSGGCGLAALYHIAKQQKNAKVFLGARDKHHLFYVDEAKKLADVRIATDDGSAGFHGFVTQLLEQELKALAKKNVVFYNCGPEQMIEKAVAIEKKYVQPERIFTSIDYATKCGIGLCGSCATPRGKRLCVDGPFFND